MRRRAHRRCHGASHFEEDRRAAQKVMPEVVQHTTEQIVDFPMPQDVPRVQRFDLPVPHILKECVEVGGLAPSTVTVATSRKPSASTF